MQRDGVKTGWSTETGRAGRGPPPRTQPGAGNERDPFRTSGTDVPAPRSESLGKYEQEAGGGRLEVFDLDILFSKRIMER